MEKFINEKWIELDLSHIKPTLKYAVSNYGRIKSFKNNIEEGRLLNYTLVNRFPSFRVRGKSGEQQYYLHRLIAELFIGPTPDNKSFVIHLDHNKENNYYENLEYADQAKVTEHNKTNPLVIARREKDKFQGKKLTATKVKIIKKMINDPNRKTRMKIIAKQFGISEMQLYRIKTGENWSHVKVDED